MFNLFGDNREKGLRIVGYLLAVVVIVGLVALYFPIWYSQ